MYVIEPVTGHIGGECFLLVSEKSALLLDAGFDFCAAKTAENIRAILGERPLDYILATHSHYDHISGAAAIKRRYPGLKLVGSQHAGKVLSLENARAQMRELNADMARDAGIDVAADHIDELSLDIALDDGGELRLPDMTVRAVATPGHTRCSMSYYFPEENFVLCGETVGIAPAYPEVTPCMIVGYRSTLDSIERLRLLRPGRVFVSHTGFVPEGEENMFFDNARKAAEGQAAMLLDMHDRGCSENEMVDALVAAYYHSSAVIQPLRAFVLNAHAQIPRILRELGRLPQKPA